MHKTITFIFVLLISLAASATEPADLDSLRYYMQKQSVYDQQREARIAELQSELSKPESDRYAIYSELFNECQSYHFDRAMEYADLLKEQAALTGEKDKIVYAAVCKGFAYLSAGLFKEGCDLFDGLDTHGLSTKTYRFYCFTYARTMYDLADYDRSDLAHSYCEQGDHLLREALSTLTAEDTVYYWRCTAMLDQRKGLPDLAIRHYQKALADTKITDHDRAIIYSTMAYLYSTMGDTEAQQHYNILAAIADIRSSTKETVAMRWVAERLYQEGNINMAVQCIRHAEDDARFYNARHRQVEISQVLPIIEQDNINRLRRHNRRVVSLGLASFALLCLSIAMLMMYRRRNKQLSHARQTIEQMNTSLLVANKLKEEYLSSLLCWQSDFIGEVEKYQRHIRHAAEKRRYDELTEVPKQVDAQRRRAEFYNRFDTMFLQIFPTFVSDFNALLRPDEQIVLHRNELLNTDLRIFALMRMGVMHNEVIAQILDYSVNTIYTYKTKVKNRSDLPTEEFYTRIMQIPSFSKADS